MRKLVTAGVTRSKDIILHLFIEDTELGVQSRVDLPVGSEEDLQALESLVYNAQFCANGILIKQGKPTKYNY